MWLNNPLRLDTNNEHVNIGGYNGRYTDVNGKYKGEGGGKTIPTAFDDDGKIFTGANKDDLGLGAKVYNNNDGTGEHTRTVETAAKQTEDQRLCSSDLDRPEALGFSNGYVSSPGCGNTFNSLNYDTADEGSARASRNTYDFYTAPTMQSAWGDIIWKNRIPNPSAAKFGNADLVLLQDGISMNPTITNREYDTGQSYVFYKQILSYHNLQADSSAQDSKWDTPDKQGREYGLQENHSQVNNYEFSQQSEENRYLHKTGLTFFSTYCDNYATTDLYKKNAVNNIVIHNPVSVANSFVIGADKKYDQRIYGSDKSNAATAKAEEGEEKCPGNAADCVFRVQNCKYAQRIRKAAFSVDNAEYSPYDENDPESGGSSGIVSDVQTKGGVNTVTYLDDTGFTLKRNDGVTPAYPVSGSDPADSDGNVKHPGRNLQGSRGAALEFSWDALGTDTSKKNERYEIGGDFTCEGGSEKALFTTKATKVIRRADGKIEVKVSDGNTYVSEETVGSGKHTIAYRFAFDSVLFKDTSVKIGGKTYTFKANTGVKVDGKDLTFKGGLSGTHGMKTMTDTYGTWARILYQDVSDGNNYFTSASDAEDSDGAKKFSKLKYLDEFRGSDGKFTFMLDYPDATGNFAGAHNIWKQSSNPYTAQKTNGSGSGNDADGFEDIDYQVPGYKGRGLEYNGGPCVLDGTVGHDNWWIAVGSIDTDHGYRAAGKQGGMPAWHNGVTSQNCAEVELWVLVNNQGGGIPYLDNMGSGFTIGNERGGNVDASYILDNIWVDRLPGSTEHTAGCFSLGDESHEMTSQDYYNGTGSLSGTKAKSYSFDYTGKEQSITLPAGTYTFEAWGASGGGETVSRHAYNSTGGEGGYTKASFTLKKETEVKVYVGGAGKYGTSAAEGGYNGGGSTAAGSCGSGGGATDFRLGSGLKSRFLVAGGGGGADNGTGSPVNASASLGGADDGSGGSGGGKTAQGAWIDGTYHKEYGATQNSGNALGQGASATAVTDTGGAGGGWYGGLCTNNNNGGAGGGSGYIKGGAGFSGDYVSDQGSDKNVILETLDETVCKVGGNTGNGKAKITLSASSVSGGADTDLRREPVKTKTLISDSESYSGSCPDNASYYTDFRQYSVDAPFREDEMFQLDCDVKGSGTLVNYFYGASNYLKVDGVYSPTTGSSGTAADGHNEVRLTSDYKHYTVRFRLSGNGDGNVTKYVLFRVFPGSSASVKNVKFVKYSAASQGLIDWTAKYDKGQMTQAGRNNTHTHTVKCLTGPNGELSNGLKAAIQEASDGDTYDLKKMLGTKVWNKVKSRMNEATSTKEIKTDGFENGKVFTYQYTGGIQKVTLPKGEYKLEVWGAQGGNSEYNNSAGMKGSYARGTLSLNNSATVYIVVGGSGNINRAGYNGGGSGSTTFSSSNSGAGGGATNISYQNADIVNTDRDKLIIVAGGGGGAGQNNDQGYYSAQGGYSSNGQGQNAIFDNGAGGGGYSGGLSGRGGPDGLYSGWNDESGSAGSSYTGTLKDSEIQYQNRSGNGAAQITVLSATETQVYTDPAKVGNIVKEYLTKDYFKDIPATITTEGHTIINPVWYCEGKYDRHVCTDQCKTRANGKVGFVLNCPEPHHTGSHYEVGDEMCYDACHDDAKHAAAAKGDTAKDPKTGKPESAGERFIRLDNYFDVKYPNTGNFYESNLHGIHSTTDTKGMSYVNDMDCFEWTREKWIKFPYDTLYYRESTGLWEEHQAEEWYQVDVFYTTADGKAVPYTDYHFYCQLDGAQGSTRNSEVKDGIVEFYVESINDPGPDGSPYGYLDPYGRDEENTYSDEANRNPDITNAARYFQRNGNLMHSAYTNAYKQDHIDVVGRIGNLLFEDTQDWRFSNFFKKADRSGEWNVDGIVKKVDQNIQNMYFSWHRNTKGANGLYDTAEDLRGEKVKPENEWYNTYTTAKWTDIGDDFYKSAPAPLEAYDSYMAQYTQTGGVAEQLETDQMKFGYNLLWDISTIGDYYKGNLQIEPKYFALDTKTDEIIPVDVYQKTDSSAKPVNYFGLMDEYVADDADGYGQSRYKKYSDKLGQGYPMTLDWKHEAARRNCTGKEADQTQWVGENYGIDTGETYIDPATGSEKVLFAPKVIPHGEAYTIGTAQFMYLGDRARTYIGNDHVTALHNDIKSVDNPSGEIRDAGVSGNNQELYYQYSPLGNQQEELAKQSVSEDATDHFYYIYGQRWHVTLGLPTDVAFTDARDKDGDGLPDHIDPFSKITDENGDEEYAWEQFDYENKYKGRYVFLETATITAIGPVWNLRYDQKVDNGVVNLKVDGTYKEYKFVQDRYFPTLLAVYDGIPNKSDVNILQTH